MEKKGQTPLFKVKQTPKEIETKKSAGVSKEKKVRSRFHEKSGNLKLVIYFDAGKALGVFPQNMKRNKIWWRN